MKFTFSIMVCMVCLFGIAQSQQSKKWEIMFNGGKTIHNAILQQLQGDSVGIIADGYTGLVALHDISKIGHYEDKSTLVKDAAIGGLVGGGLGFAIASFEDQHKKDAFGDISDTRAIWGIAGFVAGGVLGWYAGDISSEESVYELAGADSTVKQKIIGNLIANLSPDATLTEEKGDAVYLKNGSIIRGAISENTADSTVTVQTLEGSKFVNKRSDVLMISKHVALPTYGTTQNIQPVSRTGKFDLEINVGASIPSGDFASKSSGNALVGYMFSADVAYNIIAENNASLKFQWLTTAAVSLNGLDTQSPQNSQYDVGIWVTAWPLTGFRATVPLTGEAAFYASAQAGALIGSYPSLDVKTVNGTLSEPTATAKAFAYRVGLGTLISDKFLIEAGYLASNPKYGLTETETLTGSKPLILTGTVKQQTDLFTITVGMIF